MEMQKIATCAERNEEIEETSGLMEKAKTKEEAEPDHYSKLQDPCEDVYSEAIYDTPVKRKAEKGFRLKERKQKQICNLSYGRGEKKESGAILSFESQLSVELEVEKDKQTEGNTRPYRGVCIFLTIMCLVLLLIVIILSVQLQTGSTVCPEGEGAAAEDGRTLSVASSCSPEQCQVHVEECQTQYRRCSRCAVGWQKFGSSCFFLSTFRLSWNESQRNCSAEGGSLAVINDTSIQHFLTRVGNMPYWIGLRRNRGTWTWNNKIVLQDSYWADDKSDKECAILRGGGPPDRNWITTSCKSHTYFICQMQL